MGNAISSADAAATDLLLPSAAKTFTVTMVGLDGAGCTSILTRLVGSAEAPEGELPPTEPTMTLDRVLVPYGVHRITFWNPSGHERMRNLWPLSYPHAHAFLFVVDASAPARLLAAKEALREMSAEWMCAEYPLLVAATKADLPDSVDAEKIAVALELEDMSKRRELGIDLVMVSALSGTGLKPMLNWFVRRVSHYHISTHNSRVDE